MAKTDKELEKLENKYGKDNFEIDVEHQLIKKKGYNVISSEDLEDIGLNTIAEKISMTERKPVEKVLDRLKKYKGA